GATAGLSPGSSRGRILERIAEQRRHRVRRQRNGKPRRSTGGRAARSWSPLLTRTHLASAGSAFSQGRIAGARRPFLPLILLNTDDTTRNLHPILRDEVHRIA